MVSNFVQRKLSWPAQRGWVRQWQPGQMTRCEPLSNPEQQHVESPSGHQILHLLDSLDSVLWTNYSTSRKSPCLLAQPGLQMHVYNTCTVWAEVQPSVTGSLLHWGFEAGRMFFCLTPAILWLNWTFKLDDSTISELSKLFIHYIKRCTVFYHLSSSFSSCSTVSFLVFCLFLALLTNYLTITINTKCWKKNKNRIPG